MATIRRFEDLEIWQLSRMIYQKVTKLAALLRGHKEFRFAEQMKSSSGSIMDNIAEGFGRASKLEFINSLSISKGEAAELNPSCLDDLMTNSLTSRSYLNIAKT